MSAVANIVMNDAQATPVAHTFIPLGPDKDGRWWFEDQSGANPVGYNRISLQLTRPSLASPRSNAAERVNRAKITIHTPTLETVGTADNGITPPPTVAYIPRWSCEFIMDERSTLQQRKDLKAYAKGILSNTLLVDMIESLQGIY